MLIKIQKTGIGRLFSTGIVCIPFLRTEREARDAFFEHVPSVKKLESFRAVYIPAWAVSGTAKAKIGKLSYSSPKEIVLSAGQSYRREFTDKVLCGLRYSVPFTPEVVSAGVPSSPGLAIEVDAFNMFEAVAVSKAKTAFFMSMQSAISDQQKATRPWWKKPLWFLKDPAPQMEIQNIKTRKFFSPVFVAEYSHMLTPFRVFISGVTCKTYGISAHSVVEEDAGLWESITAMLEPFVERRDSFRKWKLELEEERELQAYMNDSWQFRESAFSAHHRTVDPSKREAPMERPPFDPDDLYQMVGALAGPFASVDEIARSFRRELLKWHPDQNGGCEENVEYCKVRTQGIIAAFQTLRDPIKKKEYDRKTLN